MSASADTGRGPGRFIVAVYAVLALAATGRSSVQVIASFTKAPLAYTLSAAAALIYLVATFALLKGGPRWTRVAWIAVSIELLGVLVVGGLSYALPALFPDKTVWSHFGSGYGFVPLVLPLVGLWWLRRVSRSAEFSSPRTAPRG